MLLVNLLIVRRQQDEERKQLLRDFNLVCRIMIIQSNPFTLDDILFISLFRLRKDLVHNLIHQLMPYMSNSNHPIPIAPEMKIFAALSFYATGSYQKLIGQSYNISMSQQSISNCVKEVSNLIYSHLRHEWIKFPTTNEEKNMIKLKFMQRTQFPGVIGAIDCTHVAILSPRQEEHNYVNRKGYHSINVQIICDYDLKILSINPTHAGATHDAFIWRSSVIKQELQRCYNEGDKCSWLLGDSGYPLQPWLMAPVLDAIVNSPEDRYTKRHCEARNCVERCNGVLKMRFRCLLGERVLRYKPEAVAIIITACAILHNMCINANMLLHENILPAEVIAHVHENDIPEVPIQAQILNEARQIRQNIIRRYFTN